MKYFSHRGNLNGPKPQLENSLPYIQSAIDAGFDVEIDLRIIGDDFYLGHDYPQFMVNHQWIEDRKDSLIIHIKDFVALKKVISNGYSWHIFCHQLDLFTTTNKGIVWLHDINGIVDKNCIVPLLSLDNVNSYAQKEFYGVCSDFIIACKSKFKD